jgi:DNA-binding CsgD family transcriptional regulator/PAS domain-containing protein
MSRYPIREASAIQHTLDLIYEAPFSDGAWQSALTAVADLAGADFCDLNFFEQKSLTYKRWEHARIDADAIQRYMHGFTSDMHNTHPRMPIVAQMKTGQMFSDSGRWSVSERNRMPLFTDVFHRAGLRDGITACVSSGGTDSDLIILGAYYAREIKPSALPERRRRAATVLPHLRRACAVEARLLQARRQTAALTETLHQMNEAVAMLSLSGQVVFANHSAAALLNRGKGIGLTRDQRLFLGTAEARTKLSQALHQCASMLHPTATPVATAILPIVVSQAHNPPLILTIQPLPKTLAGAYGATALAFMNDPVRTKSDSSDALRTIYKLTPVEVKLAQALCSGSTLKRYADVHQISYETTRTYLRRIFEKTAVRRQSELINLLRALH